MSPIMVDSDTDTRELVRISGRGGLVNITIDDSEPVRVACRTLREHLGRERNLYSEGQVIVDIGKRILSHDEQELIRKVIDSESGLAVQKFWCDPNVLESERNRIDHLIESQAGISDRINGKNIPGSDRVDTGRNTTPQVEESEGREGIAGSAVPVIDCGSVPADVVRGTWRAGEVSRFPGNVVVVGNVNPGAQIIAHGDILVFGKLRGLAHAGAAGDATAVILAMSSSGPQLRIADYRWDPEAVKSGGDRLPADAGDSPIIARIRNRSVHVSPYLKNHFIDHGGNPNER